MIHESIKPFAEILKKARLEKKLSQRDLSHKIGIPQSHISKIENGQVDLQVSSLIQFSRILDLELVLVPKQLIPIIRALQSGTSDRDEQIPLYRLEEEDD